MNEEAYTEALRKYAENPEIEEYKKWKRENKKLEMQVQKLLDEFYVNREINDMVKLVPDEFGGSFEIMSKANIDWKPSQKNTEKEKEMLEIYQKEMNTFGEFLKKKFFED